MLSNLGWLVAAAVSVAAALLFIPRQLWKRWRERIVDRLDLFLRRRVSRFERRYRDSVLSALRFIDHKGLATIGFYTPELDDVFVDVSLAYRAPHEIPEGALAQLPAGVTDRHAISDFLDREQPVVLAVVGVPGSGKTTLLRHTARRICQQRRGRRRHVPILLYLRDHVASIVTDPQVELPKLARATLTALGEPPGWFEDRLRAGDCVILLDGLDEVARQENRRAVADWVERQAARYPKNDFVITSRPQGYRTAPVSGAVVLQVRAFTHEQVTRFVHGWYLAVERHATGVSDVDVTTRAKEAADDLLSRLANAPALADLTVNPLLLTMIANVHRYRSALPGSRADLYGEICQVMLWRRQEAKRLPTELSGDRKEGLLRALAFTMMRHQLRDISRKDALDELKPALRRISTTMTAEDFLADVSSNGLLIEREAGQYAFAHLTFQEYLAAMHIRDTGCADVLAESVGDVWWRETALLYAARANADPIVAACLESSSITALALAFDVADHGGDLAPELRQRLDDLIESYETDPARRRLLAGVLATRHLRRNLIGRVCGRPVNVGLYTQFLTESGWVPGALDAEPDQPVIGVHASETLAFVHWVNELTGGEPRYRLPTRAELDDPTVQNTLATIPALSAWVRSDTEPDRLELWIPAGSDHPNQITAETLTEHLREDLARSTPTLAVLLLLYALAVDDDRSRTLAINLSRRLGPVTSLDYTLARHRISGLDSALALDHVFAAAGLRDRARRADTNYTVADAHVMGRELTWSLHYSLHRRGKDAQSWAAEFLRAFVQVAGVADSVLFISLDTLADNLSEAETRLPHAVSSAASDWIRTVARRLTNTAMPILRFQQPVTTDTATAVRIATLCLAAEADARDASDIGLAYRRVAAGITLLERRADGRSPATETIILAIE